MWWERAERERETDRERYAILSKRRLNFRELSADTKANIRCMDELVTIRAYLGIKLLFIYNKRYKIVYIILNKIYSKFYFYDEVTKRKDIDKICSEQKEGDLLTEVEKERLMKDYLRNKKDLEKAIKQLYKSKL